MSQSKQSKAKRRLAFVGRTKERKKRRLKKLKEKQNGKGKNED